MWWRSIIIGFCCMYLLILPAHAQIITPWSGPMPQPNPSITSGWTVYGPSDQAGGPTAVPSVSTPSPSPTPQIVPSFVPGFVPATSATPTIPLTPTPTSLSASASSAAHLATPAATVVTTRPLPSPLPTHVSVSQTSWQQKLIVNAVLIKTFIYQRAQQSIQWIAHQSLAIQVLFLLYGMCVVATTVLIAVLWVRSRRG